MIIWSRQHHAVNFNRGWSNHKVHGLNPTMAACTQTSCDYLATDRSFHQKTQNHAHDSSSQWPRWKCVEWCRAMFALCAQTITSARPIIAKQHRRLCKVSVCQSLRNIAWTHCNALHEPTLVTHNLPRITRIPASYWVQLTFGWLQQSPTPCKLAWYRTFKTVYWPGFAPFCKNACCTTVHDASQQIHLDLLGNIVW